MKRLYVAVILIMIGSYFAVAAPLVLQGQGGGGKRYYNTFSKVEPKGAWISQATYSSTSTRQHSVTYNGSTWLSLATNTNQTPTDGNANWFKQVAQGPTGATGPQGATGSVSAAAGLVVVQRPYSSGVIEMYQPSSKGSNKAVIKPFDNISTSPIWEFGESQITVNGVSYAGAGGGAWGSITGTLSAQTDLQNALNAISAGSLPQAANDNGKADGASWINTTTKELATRIGNTIYSVAMTLKTTLLGILGLDQATTNHGSVAVGSVSSHVARTLSNTGSASANITFPNFSANFRLVGFNNTSTATTGGASVTGAATATLPASSSITFKTAFTPTAAVASSNTVAITSPGLADTILALSGTGTSGLLTRTDDFERANGGLGANWTTVTGAFAPTISSGNVISSSYGDASISYWSGDTFTSNQCSTITIDTPNRQAPIINASATEKTYYMFRLQDAYVIKMYKVVSGVETQLGGDYTIDMFTGDTIGLCTDGTTLTPSRNGSNLATRSDSTITDGSPGIYVLFDGSLGIKSWTGSNN